MLVPDETGFALVTTTQFGKILPKTSIYCNQFKYKSILVQPGIEILEPLLFDGNQDLEEIDLPDTITCIGRAAFRECKKLKSIRLPLKLCTLSSELFKNSGLETIHITGSIDYIRASCFSMCKNLKTITFDDGALVLQVGQYAFQSCISLTTSQYNFQNIAHEAFANCQSIKSLNLTARRTRIANCAFANCKNLSSLIIPFCEHIDSYAFLGCNLINVNITGDNLNLTGFTLFVKNDNLSKIYLSGDCNLWSSHHDRHIIKFLPNRLKIYIDINCNVLSADFFEYVDFIVTNENGVTITESLLKKWTCSHKYKTLCSTKILHTWFELKSLNGDTFEVAMQQLSASTLCNFRHIISNYVKTDQFELLGSIIWFKSPE